MEDIIVFGTGRYYKSRENVLKEKFNIIAYIDNKIPPGDIVSEEGFVSPIYNPNSIDKLPRVIILIMLKDYDEVYAQLINMDIPSERIMSFEQIFRYTSKKENPLVAYLCDMPVKPFSECFGLDRGSAIDRYYIEKFLEENKGVITGKCLEIAESTYTLKYGSDVEPYILHVEGWGENTIKGNLETGEGIEEEQFDCAIITQTLMFTYNLESVAQNIYKMLKKGGSALITVAGISQISLYDQKNWGSYFGFHEDAMNKLFVPVFGEKNVQITSHGNVKTVMGFLYGLCFEDLKQSDFEYDDPAYPLIITVLLIKK